MSSFTMVVSQSVLLETPTTTQYNDQEPPENKTPGFSIKSLPFELRRLIYTHHLNSTQPLSINPINATHPLHKTHPLHTSSPYFQTEIPSSLYHAHQTFTFTNGNTMRQFSQFHNRLNEVRKIRIILNSPDDEKSRHRDWMWLIQDCFGGLSDIELVLPACEEEEEGVGEREGSGRGTVTKGWWICVEDAFRESMGYRVVQWEFGQGFRKRFPRLKLVNGVGSVICWSEYGDEGKGHDSGCLI